jgi:acetate kinase
MATTTETATKVAAPRNRLIGPMPKIGIRLDPGRNTAAKGEGSLSAPGECVSILLIPADEERIVARAVAEVVSR